MKGLPPGTILQLLYLEERVKQIDPGRFLEIGPGTGEISRMLLNMGWAGVSYDLEPQTVQRLRLRFSREVEEGRYRPVCGDFLASVDADLGHFDMVISSMVIEHMSDSMESNFMHLTRDLLREGGRMIGVVPASPAHWGIEDDIAGHFRRYTSEALLSLADKSKWQVIHLAGLTYPLSNMLLPLSNRLVRRTEASKLKLSNLEQTKASGMRDVQYKTNFPSVFSLILNRPVLWPWHLVQKVFASSSKCLTLYFEAVPRG